MGKGVPLVDHHDIDPGGHHLPGGGVPELQDIEEHLLLLLLEGPVFLPELDPPPDLLLGDGRLRKGLGELHGACEPVKDPDEGGEDGRKETDDGGDTEGDRVGEPDGKHLRSDFAEDEKDENDHPGRDPDPGIPEPFDGKGGSDGSRCNVHQGVCNENRDDDMIRRPLQVGEGLGAPPASCKKGLHLGMGDGEEGHFGAGEKGREEDAKKEYQDLDLTSHGFHAGIGEMARIGVPLPVHPRVGEG
jgi:hypothetical protein